MGSGVIFQIQSTVIVILFLIGFFYRSNRNIHIPIMISAIVWDILLILQIELSRGAIEKAMKVAKNQFLLNFHVSIAVTTVILYFVMARTGYLLKKGVISYRPRHKYIGLLTILLRLTTYVTSFFVVHRG